MLSAEGGVEIETVAEENPEAIAKIWIDPTSGLTTEMAENWVKSANLPEQAAKGAVKILLDLYQAYVKGNKIKKIS